MKYRALFSVLIITLNSFGQELQEVSCSSIINGHLHIRMMDCNNAINITSTLNENNSGTVLKGTVTSLQSIQITPGVSNVRILPPPNLDIRETYTTRIAVVENIENKEFFVSTSGNDNNNGDILNPFKTIKRAIEVVTPGDIVYIRGGTYRERLDWNVIDYNKSGKPGGNYITFQNYNDEEVIIKGSIEANFLENGDVAWSNYSGNIWKYKGTWPKNPQQIFYDGKMLNKMGYPNNFDDWADINGDFNFEIYIPFPESNPDSILNTDDMWPGTFLYDDHGIDYNEFKDENGVIQLEKYDSDLGYIDENLQGDLYIWLPKNENPNNHLIEISDLRRLWLSSSNKYIKLKGLRFMHSNVNHYDLQFHAVGLGPFSIVENCTFEYCDFGGLAFGSNPSDYGYEIDDFLGQVVRNSVFHHNGVVGLGANYVGGFLAENNEFYNNSIRPFDSNWNSAAIKIIPFSWGKIINNYFHDEHGYGIWFDGSNTENPIVISHNWLENIGRLPNSYLWNSTVNNEPLHKDQGSGIFIEVTNNATIYNNILLNNYSRGIYIVSSSNNKIANNLIVGTDQRGQLALDYSKRVQKNIDGIITTFITANNQFRNNLLFEKNCIFDIEVLPHMINDTTFENVINNNNNSFDRTLIFNYNNQYKYSNYDTNANTTYNDLDIWSQTYNFGLNNFEGENPLFINSSNNNWMLSSSSPAIDTGESLSYISDDYIYVSRPQGVSFDIGPYEFVSTISKVVSQNINYTKSDLIEDNFDPLTVKVYPNPSRENINIIINTKTTIREINVIDINGKIIKVYKPNLLNIYDVSFLNSGLYIFQINFENGYTLEKKIIVN